MHEPGGIDPRGINEVPNKIYKGEGLPYIFKTMARMVSSISFQLFPVTRNHSFNILKRYGEIRKIPAPVDT
jgi:hypothetical protein